MQGTWLQSLVWEDPTPHMPWGNEARVCLLQLLSPRAAMNEAHAPRACDLQQEKPPR